jgi:chromosome segregation ATPase
MWWIQTEAWGSDSWLQGAIEDDRIRQISFVPGRWKYIENITAWERTRRQWEKMVLMNGTIDELITWLEAGGDTDGSATYASLEDDLPSVDNDSGAAIDDVTKAAEANGSPELVAVSEGMSVLDEQTKVEETSANQATDALDKEMDRTIETSDSTSEAKKNDDKRKLKVAGAVIAAGAAVAAASKAYEFIASGALCRNINAAKKFASDASGYWDKMKLQWKRPRPDLNLRVGNLRGQLPKLEAELRKLNLEKNAPKIAELDKIRGQLPKLEAELRKNLEKNASKIAAKKAELDKIRKRMVRLQKKMGLSLKIRRPTGGRELFDAAKKELQFKLNGAKNIGLNYAKGLRARGLDLKAKFGKLRGSLEFPNIDLSSCESATKSLVNSVSSTKKGLTAAKKEFEGLGSGVTADTKKAVGDLKGLTGVDDIRNVTDIINV